MKNKKFLVIIATALMACLVVGMGAMTYSRYITTGNTGTQTATAAKWGFVVTANAENLFGSDYTKGTTYSEVTTAGNGVAIKATSTANDVVAPGATGSMSFSVDGTAEVLAKITITGTVESEICDGLGTAAENYPVKWTLKKGDDVVEGCNGVTLVTIMDKISTTSETKINPGQPASQAGTYTLSWVWNFENGAEGNVKDTVIGYKANNAGVTYNSIKDLYVGTKQISEVYTSDVLTNVNTN